MAFLALIQPIRFTESLFHGLVHMNKIPRRTKLIFVTLAIFCVVSLLVVTLSPNILRYHGMSNGSLANVQRSRPIVVRTISTNRSGIGSVVAQLRSSAVLASMLGASLSTFSVTSSEHMDYRVASLLGLDTTEHQLDARKKVCSIGASVNYARTLELIETWCNNAMSPKEADRAAVELRSYYSECGLILDDRPWDYRYDMGKCTWLWVKDIFSKIGLRRRKTGIGLHKRWGDLALDPFDYDPVTPARSTPIPMGAELLRKIRACGIQDELSVYMEWHNDTVLSGLEEPYRIVDTGDPINDLIDLASNRLLILDVGSYTVLAHQIAQGGLSIVPDDDQFDINWFDNGVNHAIRWHDLLSVSCSDLTVLLNS